MSQELLHLTQRVLAAIEQERRRAMAQPMGGYDRDTGLLARQAQPGIEGLVGDRAAQAADEEQRRRCEREIMSAKPAAAMGVKFLEPEAKFATKARGERNNLESALL